MKTFNKTFIAMAIALMVFAGMAQAQSTTTVLVGTVVQVIHTGDDLFVKLDTDNDGLSDTMLKLSLTDTVTDAQGQTVQAGDIVAGMSISDVVTKDSSGYYEPFEADHSAPQTAISGTVTQVRQVGNTVFADVDTDGDGVADLQVKLEGRDTVLDDNGNPLPLDSLEAGSQITIPAYRYDSDNDEFEGQESTIDDSNTDQSADDNGSDHSNDGTDGNDHSNDRGQDRNDNSNDNNDDGGEDDGGEDD